MPHRVADAFRIDRLARLEKLRAVTAALQVAESVRFAQSQVAEQMAAKVPPETGSHLSDPKGCLWGRSAGLSAAGPYRADTSAGRHPAGS
jgi:hypothetical protein